MFQEYFGEEHRLLRDSVRRFVEREVRPHIEEWEDKGEFPRDLYKKAAQAGFLGLEYPQEYGGTPADKLMVVALIEEFVRQSGSTGLYCGLFSHTISMPHVNHLGTEEQKRRFLVPVLAGEKIASLGVTEPNAGSDVANLATRAVRDGDHYVVNGAKTFITSGCRADFVTTAVRTGGPGAKGISLLVVETSTPGFSVSKKIRKMGWHCSDTAELSFVDCRVPAANLLGKENEGFKGIMVNFQNERLSLAVQAHATAMLALEESIRYAKSREAFGSPLAGFQALRHKLVDMATQVEVAREFNCRVAAKMDAGMDVTREVSMAKIFSCRVCDQAVFDAVQIHGGYGFAREYVVERLYRDSRVLSIGGGTTEVMKEIVGRMII
ncbi:MAG TPA: acyl-CoA dehydrogenase family protein [Syntrophales bacterium]|nr:acyl-CoA dehydrogenase family protein [Syntrophales bacterium]HOM07543.1 acyl-CoA dehydrogenase family protein [Syntrophales bacterium]HOO00105.1 acyl-CoA dehydrogenase family protein [Syntrophales bacterium]